MEVCMTSDLCKIVLLLFERYTHEKNGQDLSLIIIYFLMFF